MRHWLESNTKMLVWWFSIHSTIWVYASYILAFLGRDDIAESLSRVIVTEIIAVILGYMLKAVVENIFKNNVFKGMGKRDEKEIKRDY